MTLGRDLSRSAFRSLGHWASYLSRCSGLLPTGLSLHSYLSSELSRVWVLAWAFFEKFLKAERTVVPSMKASTRLIICLVVILGSAIYALLVAKNQDLAKAVAQGYIAV